MDDSVRAVEDRFIQHWGDMATLWGLSAAMGRIHGLLYITGRAMTAEEIMARLQISRGGVSMALRALLGWGTVRRHYLPGQRKQHFVAEQDPWTWFKRVIAERRRREADPIVDAIDDCLDLAQQAPADDADLAATRERLERLVEFVRLFGRAIDLFLALDREAIVDVLSGIGAPGPTRSK
ncbi:MAG TPA: transcriptional regulator [Chloroflexota bacterium]|nr:transcriptional regulator [Chloroflexota bacterium]